MSQEKEQSQEIKVECQVCLKEVPLSEAKSQEATDYVLHFCGLECYEKWRKQNSPKQGIK